MEPGEPTDQSLTRPLDDDEQPAVVRRTVRNPTATAARRLAVIEGHLTGGGLVQATTANRATIEAITELASSVNDLGTEVKVIGQGMDTAITTIAGRGVDARRWILSRLTPTIEIKSQERWECSCLPPDRDGLKMYPGTPLETPIKIHYSSLTYGGWFGSEAWIYITYNYGVRFRDTDTSDWWDQQYLKDVMVWTGNHNLAAGVELTILVRDSHGMTDGNVAMATLSIEVNEGIRTKVSKTFNVAIYADNRKPAIS